MPRLRGSLDGDGHYGASPELQKCGTLLETNNDTSHLKKVQLGSCTKCMFAGFFAFMTATDSGLAAQEAEESVRNPLRFDTYVAQNFHLRSDRPFWQEL